MPSLPKHAFVVAALAAAGSAHAFAPVSPADIVDTGLMSATCSTLRGSGNGSAINDVLGSGFFDAFSQCTGQAATSGSASSASSFANALASTHASGSATMGRLHLMTDMDTPGGSAATFPASISQTAFGDRLTVDLAGQTGQSGFVLVGLHVNGSLDAFRAAGAAGLNVAITKNDQTLSSASPGYDRGTGNATSTDRQVAAWAVASYPVPGPLHDHLDIDEVVVFSIPVVFGTSFEMVVIGQSIAASRSSDGSSNALSDFAHTITWSGVQGVLQNGAAVNGYTVSSLSGTDWTQAAAVPEPASALLLTLGLAGVLPRLRRAKG